MTQSPSFPPLLSGLAVAPGEDPFQLARDQARGGCDAGLIVHDMEGGALRAAIVFAPEVPLSRAVAMLPLCAVGLQNAIGALSPPEVGMHLDWDGGLRLNGALCGRMRAAASTQDPKDVPDWLVVGFELTVLPANDAPGETPDETSLYGEGCGDVDTLTLLESWARHTLVWINRWADEGAGPLHREWSGLAWHADKEVRQGELQGKYLGVDEDFGLLMRAEDGTSHLIPMTRLLETDS